MAIQHAVETQKCPFVEFFTVPEWKSKELAALSAHPITSLAIWGVGKDHDWVFLSIPQVDCSYQQPKRLLIRTV